MSEQSKNPGKRQQQRAADRETANAKTRKAPAPKKPDSSPVLDGAKRIKAEDLSDREVRGALLAQDVAAHADRRVSIDGESTLYVSAKKHRAYEVTRKVVNNRGTLTIDYNCNCGDFAKEGRNGCMHTFAEQLAHGEVVVVGAISAKRAMAARARRRAPRNRKAANGQSARSTQRSARMKLADNLARYIPSLVRAYEKKQREQEAKAGTPKVVSLNAGRIPTPAATRAAALLFKVANGLSADEMRSVYDALIKQGALRLPAPPHPNTLTEWMNDPQVTKVLESWIPMTAAPFVRREVGAIIDSSKISQMRTASYKEVAYGTDERPAAQWMKCHTIVGVETTIVMAVAFSANSGAGVADVNFVKPLVNAAREVFALQFLLGDKGYYSGNVIEWLWKETHIRAVVPVKKNINRLEDNRKGDAYDTVRELIMWYDNHPREFHEVYRLRPKIESFFSVLKHVAQGYCWSRGRIIKDVPTKGRFSPMEKGPCTAWKNEALCKFLFMNLRTTGLLEEETGVQIDYLTPGRNFPPPIEPLLHAA